MASKRETIVGKDSIGWPYGRFIEPMFRGFDEINLPK